MIRMQNKTLSNNTMVNQNLKETDKTAKIKLKDFPKYFRLPDKIFNDTNKNYQKTQKLLNTNQIKNTYSKDNKFLVFNENIKNQKLSDHSSFNKKNEYSNKVNNSIKKDSKRIKTDFINNTINNNKSCIFNKIQSCTLSKKNKIGNSVCYKKTCKFPTNFSSYNYSSSFKTISVINPKRNFNKRNNYFYEKKINKFELGNVKDKKENSASSIMIDSSTFNSINTEKNFRKIEKPRPTKKIKLIK